MLSGTSGIDELTDGIATLASFDTEAVVLPGARVFQSLWEIAIGGRQSSLPPALHPTNPPTFVLQVWECPQSPWGAFRLAQGRVGCRSGLRPRGMVQGCVCDNPSAADALRRRWGFPARVGAVELHHGYDEVMVAGSRDGVEVIAMRAADPVPLDISDVAYTTTVALAHTPRGLRLVQIDVDVTPTRVERLRPRVEGSRFGAGPGGWLHPSVRPIHPVSASIALGDVALQRLRFVCQPDELAFTGTEPVAPT
jgi:hypothetical protein